MENLLGNPYNVILCDMINLDFKDLRVKFRFKDLRQRSVITDHLYLSECIFLSNIQKKPSGIMI